jgi:tetratricopeptide (TPR) repeat protein
MNATLVPKETQLNELIQQAETAFTTGEFQMAEQHLIAALDHNPQRADLMLLLGHTYLERQEFEAGLRCYEDVAVLCPNFAPVESSRALALQLLGRTAEAKAAAERALQLANDDTVALKVLVRIYFNAGQGMAARKLCARLLALEPNDPQARAMMTECEVICHKIVPPVPNSTSANPGVLAGLVGDYPARVAAWRKLGTEHLLQQFFVGDFDSAVAIYPKPKPGKIGSDGLPLPPVDLTMGYGAGDLDQYLACARRTYGAFSKLLIDHQLTLESGDYALDWGCAAGRALRMFQAEARRGVNFWGGDVHSPSIRWAANHLSPPFRFFNCSSLPNLPFPDFTFKFIYGISVMTHLAAARDLWLLELGRVLRKDGLLVLTIHDENTWAYFRRHGAPGWMPESLRGDFEMPGECIEIRGSQWDHTYTFFHSDYIRRVWGQFFQIAEIRPLADGYQAAVIMRHHRNCSNH